MSNPLSTALKEGLAAQWAAQSDPDRPMLKEFGSLQMSTVRDGAVDSRMVILEKLEKKIERLKAEGADGRTIQTYQAMHEQLGMQIVGGNR
jgi:thiamine biosynthesis protein ThiC